MSLFDLPTTRSDKASDKKVAKQAEKKSKSAPVTAKGGGSISQRISAATVLVERALGVLKDKFEIIWDRPTLHDYLTECLKQGVVAIDTETEGLDPISHDIAGFSLATYGQKAVYVPINHINYITHEKVDGQISRGEVQDELDWFFSNQLEVVMFNATFDIRIIRNHAGCKNVYCTWDCSLASRCLNENEPEKNLKYLHAKYVLDGKEEFFRFDDLFDGIPFTQVPIRTGYIYAAHDAQITLEYYDYQKPFLTATDPICIDHGLVDVAWVFHNIEMPCVPVVADIEDTGVCFDTEYAKKVEEKYHKLIEMREEKFHKACEEYRPQIEAYKKKNPDHKLDEPINIKSSSQLCTLIFDIIGIEPPTIHGKPSRSTNKETFALLPSNAVIDTIRAYKEISTIVSMFVNKLPKFVKADGRIHGRFNQYGADTGRFSAKDPNLQQIPSHITDIRPMFKATDGYVMMSADYSQQEPKVMTEMCGDPKMKQSYIEGKDLYASLASISFNVDYRECLEFKTDEDGNFIFDKDGNRITYKEGKERRGQAKPIFLGTLYGRGIDSIAEQLKVSREKAQIIQDKIFKNFPAIPQFENDSQRMVEELGYVTTLWGRKRRFPVMLKPDYEFKWTEPEKHSDILDFTSDGVYEVPQSIQTKYLNLLANAKKKKDIFEKANKEGIWIIDNVSGDEGKISTRREVVNARIQGSAADMTKLAMIEIAKNKRLKELGFRLLIQVHDELIGECPKDNMKEVAKLFAECMSKAAETKLTIPISCDVEITTAWYGEKVEG